MLRPRMESTRFANVYADLVDLSKAWPLLAVGTFPNLVTALRTPTALSEQSRPGTNRLAELT
jgi:hypothetical protein